jgi:hypothetical protein
MSRVTTMEGDAVQDLREELIQSAVALHLGCIGGPTAVIATLSASGVHTGFRKFYGWKL